VNAWENRLLRKTYGPKKDEVKRAGENCVIRRFMILLHSNGIFVV
jgi:hypothetical protein